MQTCGEKATLVITQTAQGTSTHVVLRRVPLSCRLPAGHPELHHDTELDERWKSSLPGPTMILRHEDEQSG
jgi:hypothetical protein